MDEQLHATRASLVGVAHGLLGCPPSEPIKFVILNRATALAAKSPFCGAVCAISTPISLGLSITGLA